MSHRNYVVKLARPTETEADWIADGMNPSLFLMATQDLFSIQDYWHQETPVGVDPEVAECGCFWFKEGEYESYALMVAEDMRFEGLGWEVERLIEFDPFGKGFSAWVSPPEPWYARIVNDCAHLTLDTRVIRVV